MGTAFREDCTEVVSVDFAPARGSRYTLKVTECKPTTLSWTQGRLSLSLAVNYVLTDWSPGCKTVSYLSVPFTNNRLLSSQNSRGFFSSRIGRTSVPSQGEGYSSISLEA